MKTLKTILLSATCLALVVGSASAQERNADRLFWQVRDDLNRVQANSYPGWSDRRRIDHTKHELNELQAKFDRGRFDRGELNDVIGALNNVVADNRMPPRDREVLSFDLRRLNEFRERHQREGWREGWR